MIVELLAALSLARVPAQASTQTLGDRPVAVTGADASTYFSWLAQRAVRVTQEARKDGCDTRLVDTFKPTVWPIAAIPSFMDDKASGEQMIVERVLVEGCGQTSLQNVGVFIDGSGNRWSLSLLQGESRTSPRESTSRYAEAFGVAMPHFDSSACSQEEARRTMRFDPVTLPWGSGSDAEWSELWPVSVCGQVMPVRMDFSRAADGMLTSQSHWLDPAKRP